MMLGFFLELELGVLFPGNCSFKAFGVTKEEVNMKNISNKKIMSVREDILNVALTLFLFLIPIATELVGLR